MEIRDSHECDLCGKTQAIEHLLHNCVYVRPLWQIVELVFYIGINFKCILGLDEQFEHGDIITIVSFLCTKIGCCHLYRTKIEIRSLH